jgi:Domain of unknown function (DUF4279)
VQLRKSPELMRGPLGAGPRLENGGYLSENEFTAGGEIDEVSVSLRVVAPDLEPSDVTALLGVEPTFAARKGDRRRSGSTEVVQRTGIWIFALPESREWELANAIRTLLARLPEELLVWERLRAQAETDVFCGLHLDRWNRGVELPPELLRQLADRRLSLGLDIYARGSDPEESE